MLKLKKIMTTHFAALHTLASKSPKLKEFQNELVEPGGQIERGNIFDQYFREDHYNGMLSKIMDISKE
jgi:hypothetical protein